MNEVGVVAWTCDLVLGTPQLFEENWNRRHLQRQYVHEKAALFSSLIKS